MPWLGTWVEFQTMKNKKHFETKCLRSGKHIRRGSAHASAWHLGRIPNGIRSDCLEIGPHWKSERAAM